MDLGEKMNLFLRMDALIRRKATGSPEQFARFLGVSERSLYAYLKKLKEMDGPIYFDSSINSYCYEYEVTFSIGFLPKERNLMNVRGGFKEILIQEYDSLPIFCSESIYI